VTPARKRCPWPSEDSAYLAYHDAEWGVPVHDDRVLFEFLLLEGAQAGLAWITVLRKREGYQRAFAGFDPAKVARFDARRRKRILESAEIVRNRLKVESATSNARAFLALQKEFGSFDAWLWDFVDGRPVQNAFRRMADVPAETPTSLALSRELKRRGFRFVGPTICYAYMQAVGMVNDHLTTCFRHRALGGGRRRR